jgi:hypothetical protein
MYAFQIEEGYLLGSKLRTKVRERRNLSGPSATTIKRLFALSGNRCAFPGCTHTLFDQNGTLIADVCHIAGDKPGAKRHDPLQTAAQRQGFNNLIVLCANHHRIVDSDETTYTRPALRAMKRVHEATATEEFIISDRQAEKIAAFLGGAVTAIAFGEIAREVANVVRAIHDALPKSGAESKETTRGPPPVLIDALRYAPRGTFQALGTDEQHWKLGAFFVEVFRAAGWRLIEGAKLELGHPLARPQLTLLFILRDRHQVSNAQRAIEEIFDRCGFRRDGSGTVAKDSAGHLLRIGFAVTARP